MNGVEIQPGLYSGFNTLESQYHDLYLILGFFAILVCILFWVAITEVFYGAKQIAILEHQRRLLGQIRG